MAQVLVVCNVVAVREDIVGQLAEQGHRVIEAPGVEEAVSLSEASPVELCIVGLEDAPPPSFAGLAPAIGGVPVIAWAAGDRVTRQDGLTLGARQVVRAPVSAGCLAEAIAAVLPHERLAGLVSESRSMRRVVRLIRQVADSPTTVLVQGESGVGKEVVARAIHEASSRRDQPFVAVHCGALSPNLLESELFGHVRGAFTDALRDRAGCFERADGGTLFLDEISTMSREAQVRLLRVIQEREVTRVGDASSRPIDVRIVVATNESLEALVAASRFRQDLYYRLDVFKIEIPPLRERREDVIALERTFRLEIGGDEAPELDDHARTRLLQHSWPGNVRELRNVVERALILARGHDAVLAEDLQLEGHVDAGGDSPIVSLPEEGISLPDLVNRIERELIARALDRVGGSRAEAARLLGLKRTTLVQKLKRQQQDGGTAVAVA